MGSGSLNAMAVFEASYKEDMSQEEAEGLVARAIRSGACVPNLIKRVQMTFGLQATHQSLLGMAHGIVAEPTIVVKQGRWSIKIYHLISE